MNIVMISTCSRPEYLRQSLDHLKGNASAWKNHTLTLVCDAPDNPVEHAPSSTVIFIRNRVGASASRNIGASSIPKYRRQEYVCFVDDDIYALPGWDIRLDGKWIPKATVLSGHAHPYNQDEPIPGPEKFRRPLLVSTVHMAMPWSIWDDVGFFCEPGGPGGSEDYDWCMRAKAKGYNFAVTDPHCFVHCGLTSSSGKRIVGYDAMLEQNAKLVEYYGLTGKVVYA